MRKIRSDSLYAQLKPEQRDLLFEWLLDEGISLAQASAQCAEQFGLQPAESSLSGFLKQHGFAWRMERAKEAANDKATSLPSDFENKKRVALAQREFEKAFHDLSVKEVIALRQLEQDERQLRLKEAIEPEKLKVMQRRASAAEETVRLQARRITLLEANAAAAKDKLTAAISKGGLTPETLKMIESAANIL